MEKKAVQNLQMSLPNLIVIGSAKCGTTSLHHYLASHGEVLMSNPKELNFFVDSKGWGNWGKGIRWYSRHFSKFEDYRVLGEASVAYSRWDIYREASKKIKSTVPNAKIIYMIRDPIERMQSHYIQMLYDPFDWPEITPNLPLETIFVRGEHDEKTGHFYRILVKTGLYGEIYRHYCTYFGQDQIFIATQERLASNGQDLLIELASFLDIDPGPFKDMKLNRLNVGREKRISITESSGLIKNLPGIRRFQKIIPTHIKQKLRKSFSVKYDNEKLISLSKQSLVQLKEMYSEDQISHQYD